MFRVALIGAGSVIFANNTIGDILKFPDLKDEVEFSLMDIDEDRLSVAASYARKRIKMMDSKAPVYSTTNAREALNGADYVINMIQVGGFDATKIDFDIPEKNGLPQTIADSHGIGGVFRALRTIPVILDYCRLMQEICPDALLINYSNPMAMNTWAIYKATRIKVVGLCHSVPLDHSLIAKYLGIHKEKLQFKAGGINHICWFLELTCNGKDVYPDFRKAINRDDIYNGSQIVIEGRKMSNKVRFEMMKKFGYYTAESSEHFAEYLPYFIKYPELVEKLDIPIGEYIRRCEFQNDVFEKETRAIAEGRMEMPEHIQSGEYAGMIIHAIQTNQIENIYGNVRNDGMINNLPDDCCVEIPCYVDKRGIHKTFVGSLPPQLAAIDCWHISVQELTVKAILEKRKDYVYQACLLDPLASSILSLDKIEKIVDELFKAHGEALSYLK